MFIAQWEKIISGQKLRMTFLDISSPSFAHPPQPPSPFPPPPPVSLCPPLSLCRINKRLPFCFTADEALLTWKWEWELCYVVQCNT